MPSRRLKSQQKPDTHTDTSRLGLEEKIKLLEEALKAQRSEFEKISQSHRRLQSRNRILEKILHLHAKPERPLENLQAILDMSMELIPGEAGSILLVDPENSELYFSVASGPVAKGLKDFRVRLGEGIAGACLKTKEVIAVSDVDKDPRFHKAISKALGFTAKSLLAVPIVHRGEGLGVIEILNRKEGNHFTGAEIEAIEMLARAAGVLLGIWTSASGANFAGAGGDGTEGAIS
ncbi:MAG: GAF domain-containing protein [Planctomycetota bacterium]|nr:GAF domain-containing protein [Planctomycetota bacterium]